MGLMKFLASPLGSIAAGAADTLTDNYWNNVLPNDEKAAMNFRETVLKKQAARKAAIATGNAINSRLASQAKALSMMEGFEKYSLDNLAATVQMIEDAGLAEEGQAVKYIMDNPNTLTKINPKLQAKPDPKADATTQTGALLGTTKPMSMKDNAEEKRSAFHIMLHGRGTRAIENSVLKELGMTREYYNNLSKPANVKRLGMGESILKLAQARKTSPYLIKHYENQMNAALAAGQINEETNEPYIKGTDIIFTHTAKNEKGENVDIPVTYEEGITLLEELTTKPQELNQQEKLIKLKITSGISNLSLASKGLATLGASLAKDFDAVEKFISNKNNNVYDREDAIEISNELHMLQNEILMTTSIKEKTALRKKIMEKKSDLNLVLLSDAARLPTTLSSLDGTLDKVAATISNTQQVTAGQAKGKNWQKEYIKWKSAFAALKDNYPNLREIQQNAQVEALLNSGEVLALTQPFVISGSVESNSEFINTNREKLSGKFIELPMPGDLEGPGNKMDATEFLITMYQPKLDSYLSGQDTSDENKEALDMMSAQLSELINDADGEDKDDINIIDELAKINKAQPETAITFTNFENKSSKGELNAQELEIYKTADEQRKESKQKLFKMVTAYEEGKIDASEVRLGLQDYALVTSELGFLLRQLDRTSQTSPYDSTLDLYTAQTKQSLKDLMDNAGAFSNEEYLDAMNLINEFNVLSTSKFDLTPDEQSDENAIREAKTARLQELAPLVTELVAISRKVTRPKLTSREEDVNDIIKMEMIAFRDNNDRDMTEDEMRVAKIRIAGMLASGNIKLTKSGPMLLRYDPETQTHRLVKVDAFTSGGGLITLNDKQQTLYEEKRTTALQGEARLGRLLTTYLEYPDAFNILGSAKLLGGDISDIFGSLSRGNKTLFGNSAKDIAAMQRARTDGIALLGEAKDILFKDPRLSDQDLKIVRNFIFVLENSSLLGTTRGQAALMVIQAAMTKDAMLRAYDLDFDKELAVQEVYEPLVEGLDPSNEQDYIALGEQVGVEAAYINSIEKQLGFKIGKDSGDSLAKQTFNRLVRGYGVDKIPNAQELGQMTEDEINMFNAKVRMAVSQMQFVMQDFHLYALGGEKHRNSNVNSLLDSHPELDWDNFTTRN
tara:strand:+ start:5602 stop:8994 length:3393 start_codon:yes stop_codon:yes gene_type:complete